MREKIGKFVALANSLRTLNDDVVRAAIADNEWFSEDGVRSAAMAIADEMLGEEQLNNWLKLYPNLPTQNPKRVGVVAAGNIPLVGFFDLLCVVLSGHKCLLKPSSKDRVLMKYVVETINNNSVELVSDVEGAEAVIVTGSDRTAAMFDRKLSEIPRLIRGARRSVAVLDGGESERQLENLAKDVFAHCGLGCRNVSEIYVPEGYNIEKLGKELATYKILHEKYLSNYRHTKALKMMIREPFFDGGFFILTENETTNRGVAEILLRKYDNVTEVERELAQRSDELQCVVNDDVKLQFARQVALGQAQKPTLTDYADGIDTMKFLEKI